MKEQIYLIGFMGSGKSSVSRRLAALLGIKCLEMDDILKTEAGKEITQIFAEDGEEAFRRMETGLLARLSGEDAIVVSSGGGAALRPENVEYMKKKGTVVLLCASPEEIYQRVRHSTNRPVLAGHMNVEYIAELMAAREPMYREAADLVVETDRRSLDEIAGEISRKLEEILGKEQTDER